ncbi:MAG: S8 family serine peptidase, partial [Chitinophagaceae bacterium]
MKHPLLRVLLTACVVLLFQAAQSQTKTNLAVLKDAAVQQAEKEKLLVTRLQTVAREKGWPLVMKRPNGGTAILTGIDEFGLPLYTSADNNIIAAATIGTNKLWPGGSSGLNLTGSSASVKDKLAVWDGGRVRATHVELTGRVVQRDAPGGLSDHSTHVAGTMMASGVNPLAKGMSYGLQELVAYDFNGHLSEMLGEAPNLLVSNHSYGSIAGWNFNESANRWEFWGQFGATEDYKFGYYSDEAQVWDSIAYNAPYYLIAKSAGNNRNQNGPAIGSTYWRYDASGNMINAGPRPAGISSNNGYDIISTYGTAKNILTVGAINPIASGYTRPEDVSMSSFSSWGPTDDGRIKPDVVADGVNLLSSISTNDNAYDILSGTSMATPNASGSLLLLQEYYNQLHPGTFIRSATLKGIIIHTASEAGPAAGPDYQHGWGLINMAKAASVITANNTTQLIQENVLNNGGSFSLPVIASGNGTISATLCWTDPKAQVDPATVNNTAKKLVNDLDIVIKKGATVYRPWILDPANPSSAATTGDNVLDNVEKIELPNVIPGETYTIEITHKGTLQRGPQAYSLIASGVGGQAYCASNPTSTAGARIDSVSFSNIRNKNVAGCTGYSSFTNLTGNLQPGQTIPIFVRLRSCDASTADKIVKVFIDANNDGDFTDANETLATSGVINGDGDFSGNITIPSALDPAKATVLRIVMQETNSAAAVTPCGTYTRGETQDYRILMTTPDLDFSVTEIVAPQAGYCSSLQQYVSIRIRNSGTADKKNIPLTAVITQGATTVATLTATYPDTIYAGTSEVYTFQTPVTLAGNTSYTITATASFIGDQSPANNQLVSTFTTGANIANPTGTAVICGTNAILKATPAGGTEFFNWYTSASATTPVASGATASTTTIAPTYYLSKNEITTRLGPANKQVYTDGGYNVFSGNAVKFTASVPCRLETARLYIGTSGKITFQLRQIVTENADGSYSYYPISSTTIDVYATAPTTPTMGDQNNNPADLGAIYYLGIDFPTAANYFLIIQCDNGASIFRNNNIATNPYPAAVPGILSIISNSATLAGDPNYYQKFWYFFYDATVKLNSCPSGRAAIVPTTAVAPVITLNGNLLSSNAPSGNQWLLGGTPIGGAVGQTYTPTVAGNYTVQVTDAGGCTMTSNIINYTPTAIPNVDPEQIGLVVSPVPARGNFKIQLKTTTKADMNISLVSTNGQQVYHSILPDFIGSLTKTIETNKMAAGVYYLQIIHDKKMYVRKITVI